MPRRCRNRSRPASQTRSDRVQIVISPEQLPRAAAAEVALISHGAIALFLASPADPLVVIGAPLVLLVATGLASYIPARRALRVEPVAALRVE